MINPTISEWLNLIFRWVHVFAGIMWVGTTYYFTWLDARLSEEEKAVNATGEPAQIWMVHSGGVYVVEKRKVPDILSRTLHWFRWEAATTWLSGMVLLSLMFYLGGGSGLLEGNARFISGRAAIAVSVGLLVLGWILYDRILMPLLGRNEKAFALIAYALVVGVAYGVTRFLSGRAAYIHMGAMFGTIMVANVWMRILPAQKKMIAAIKEGRAPDQALAAQAKLRSKQNTFMAVPVVFLMLSNHFPSTYGDLVTENFKLPRWVVLAVLVLVGWVAAKFVRRA